MHPVAGGVLNENIYVFESFGWLQGINIPPGPRASNRIHLKFWFFYIGLFYPEAMKIGSNLGFIEVPENFLLTPRTQSNFNEEKS